MTDQNTAVDPELDDDGNVIPAKIESEGADITPTPDADSPDVEDLVIPVRGSAAHIIARQKRTIDKLRSKDEEPVESDDLDEKLAPEVKIAIERGIKRGIDPVVSIFTEQADENELRDLYSQYPEAKKFDKRIRAYMGHEAWSKVPVEAIYHHLTYGSAAAATAKAKAKADKEVSHMKGAGTSHRPIETNETGIPTIEELENMSEEEFAALEHKVSTGYYKQ